MLNLKKHSMPKVDCVEAFNDNYLWLIHDGVNACAIDPGDAEPVITFLKEHGLKLDTILLTHHHHDHIGGVETLRSLYQATIIGKVNSKMPTCDIEVSGGEIITIDKLDLSFNVIATPGHTMDHVCYFNDEWLFCGDTLFSGGCGRLFEGTPANMHASLSQLRSHCPTQLIFCAHEYTEANLRFATHLEPNNHDLNQRLELISKLRLKGERTIPTDMPTEIKTNPFLRFDDQIFIDALNDKTGHHLSNPVDVFALTRKLKDSY